MNKTFPGAQAELDAPDVRHRASRMQVVPPPQEAKITHVPRCSRIERLLP